MNEAVLRTIITDANGAETLVKEADDLGRNFKDQRMTTNQIRAIFNEVRQIQGMWDINDENREKALRRFVLLKPKMAYRARKERGNAVRSLVEILDPAADLVIAERDKEKQDANFQRFVEFFEAILAYHKSYGGN
ncbi:MAG: type III-A CRISPR-associated protein Csm2 [Anaerolineae bacterium]|jgi:CRISPR-associated protein Csm2|nr:type III-A CRISPR-associated protein Csm2 [Anaerolineae bacterium]